MDKSREGDQKNNNPYSNVELKPMATGDTEYSAMDDPDMQCGIGGCRPKCLQFFAKMPVFIGVYCFSGLSTSVLAMFVTSQITTLERHFGLNSSQSGFLMSCNDIGFLTMTLFVTYSARRVHIPRALCLSAAVYGLGGLVCALAYVFDPYKTDRLYQTNAQTDNTSTDRQVTLCGYEELSIIPYNENGSTVSKTSPDCNGGQSISLRPGVSTDYTFWAVTFIAIGMLLQGIAKSPRYPYIATFVDDNVKKTKTAMYLGIVMGIGIFGPAIAFVSGGLFNTIYVTLQDVPIGIRDSRWIGAWWLGFVIYGVIGIVLAIPLFFFPRRMKPKTKLDEDLKPSGTGMKHYRGMAKAILRLFKNPIYVCVVSAGSLSLMVISGTIAYSPKYLETQYTLPTWKANVLLGVIQVSGASIGTVVGGLLTSKLKLCPVTCIKLVIGLKTVAVLLSGTLYFVGCPNPNIVGYNFKLNPQINSTGTGNDTLCEKTCDCLSDSYFPVCGSDNRNYYSPCVAGCTREQNQTFVNCLCTSSQNSTVEAGLCEPDCGMLIPYLVLSFAGALIETMTIMPGLIFQIRSVSEKDKAFAMGMSSFFNTLIGWLPGPVIMGRLIDTVCEVWNTSCDRDGSCALYDIVNFRFRFIIFRFSMGVLAILIFSLAYFKSRNKTDWSTEERTEMILNHPEGEKLMTESKQARRECIDP
ncbi:hypothetical protein ScPMuIL_008504 [Solemya velum]